MAEAGRRRLDMSAAGSRRVGAVHGRRPVDSSSRRCAATRSAPRCRRRAWPGAAHVHVDGAGARIMITQTSSSSYVAGEHGTRVIGEGTRAARNSLEGAGRARTAWRSGRCSSITTSARADRRLAVSSSRAAEHRSPSLMRVFRSRQARCRSTSSIPVEQVAGEAALGHDGGAGLVGAGCSDGPGTVARSASTASSINSRMVTRRYQRRCPERQILVVVGASDVADLWC